MTSTFVRPQAPWALRLVPPLPAFAQRILALASQEDVSAQQVSELTRMDPSFSAELLRVANSALFGVRREVTSLSQAIVIVGMDRVRSMAMLLCVNKMVRSSLRIQALRRVWQHSVATAILCEESARAAGLPRDEAYTAGLLHNLGSLGLMSAYPDEYARMLQVSDDYGFDLLKTERDLFEIDHCAAGAYLAQDWDFPDELAATLATHHDEPEAGVYSMDNIVRICWRLADSLGFAAFSPARVWRAGELLDLAPALRGGWLGGTEEELRSALQERLKESPI
ncbi:MAG: HDOD domain-containing protein [Bryobacteraceae bacterium]|nr:HDOD domain-containing protein [Bryobacteraceae bacterium]